HSRSECEAPAAVLERGETRLERGARGIRGARVVIALVLSHGLLREGGGLEDRDGDRAGQPLRFLSRVDREGLEAGLTAGRRLRCHAREYRLVEFDALALVAVPATRAAIS